MEPHPSSTPLRWLLFATDTIGLGLIYVLAYGFRFSHYDLNLVLTDSVLLFGLTNLLVLYILDLYQLEPQSALWLRPLQAVFAVLVATSAIVLTAYLFGASAYSGVIGRGVFVVAQLAFALWAASNRFWFSKWLRRITKRSRWLAIGNRDCLDAFVADLEANRLTGHFALLVPQDSDLRDKPRGLKPRASTREVDWGESQSSLTVSYEGTWDDLDTLTKDQWSGIIACGGSSFPEEVVEKLMAARLAGVRVVDLADFYEEAWYKVPVFYLQRSWFAMAHGFHLLHNPVGLRIKRICDIVTASTLLLLSSPLLVLAAMAIKLDSRGPVIFSQTRVGESGRLFTIYKLRTMGTDAEKDGAQWASQGDFRITRVGKVLRALRVDELPQLWNVLRGEMSFIGPRPERPEFTGMLEDQIPYYNLRHISKPGITGWAQVMYPYGASVEDAKEKLQYELYYIKNYSLLLDIAIITKTVRVVLGGRGR